MSSQNTTRESTPDGLDALLALPTEPAPEFMDWHPNRQQPAEPSRSSSQDHPAQLLSEAELRFVKVVIENPGRPSSTYPRMAKIGARRAQNIRHRLVELGYLREHSVNTKGRGRSSIVLEPLEPAIAAVPGSATEQPGDM